jgi:hypothetical protein
MSPSCPSCPHSDEEHQLLQTCQEVIHYPSEDYPCLCPGYRGTDLCENCNHPRAAHRIVRVCEPLSGEECRCGRG